VDALHPNLFVLAEPGRELVLSQSARVISRGIFTSVKDLHKTLLRYIREHNKDPSLSKWKYDDQCAPRTRPLVVRSES